MAVKRRYKLAVLLIALSLISIALSIGETLQLTISGQIKGFSFFDLFKFWLVESAGNFSLAIPIGVLLTFSAWIVFDIADGARRLPFQLQRFWSQDFAFGARLTARLFSFFGWLLFSAGLTGWAAFYATEHYSSNKLIGVVVAAIALGGFILALGLHHLLWRIPALIVVAIGQRSRILRFLLSPRVIMPLLLVVLVAGATTAVLHFDDLFGTYDFRSAIYGLIAVLAIVTALWWIEVRGLSILQTRPILIKRAALLSLGMMLGMILLSNLILNGNMVIRERVVNDTAYAKYILRAIHTTFDFDGDGYSSMFGGGDCNDFDAEINPDALEIPDNGVDENCLAGDFSQTSVTHTSAQHHPRKEGQPPVKNVVFIVSEAIRADMTSFWNKQHDTTPELKEIGARDCTVFMNAYSAASKTTWSLAPLLFGKRASQMKWQTVEALVPAVDDSEQSMAELLAKYGYVPTAFAIPQYIADNMKGHFQGFDFQGYYQWASDAYKKNKQISTSDLYTDTIIEHLEAWQKKGNRKPFFIYAHYFDAHAYYQPPKAHKKFGPSKRGRYMGELHVTDHHVGRLYRWLKKSGILDDTVFIFSADHGEGLGDHHAGTHGQNLYNEQTHVPLLICAPNTKPQVVTQPVSQLDLAPTILDLIGKPIPSQFMGRSLVPFLDGETPEPVDIVTEIMPDNKSRRRMTAVISDGWKLIYNHVSRSYQLFDMVNDPKEQHDQFSTAPRRTAELLPKLQAVVEEASAHQGVRKGEFIVTETPKTMIPLDVEFKDGINLLGYEAKEKTVRRGDKQTITLYWSARSKISKDYRIFVHVEKKPGDKSNFKVDHAPANNNYPTGKWKIGEIIKDEFTFEIPADWPGQRVNVWIGLWYHRRLPFTLTDKRVTKDSRYRLRALSFRVSGLTPEPARIKTPTKRKSPTPGKGASPAKRRSSSRPSRLKTPARVNPEFPKKAKSQTGK